MTKSLRNAHVAKIHHLALGALLLAAIFTIAPSASAQPSATFVTTNTTTQGSWIGPLGEEGYVMAWEVTNPPAYADVAVVGDAGPFIWAEHTSDVRGLQRPGGDRFAKTWYQVGMSSPGTFSLDVNVHGTVAHQVALYLLDWSMVGLAEQIDVLDATTLAVLDTRNASSFGAGKYLIWNIKGHVIFRVTSTNPAFFVPVVSAILFDSAVPPVATFVTTDTATQGSWIGPYGSEGYVQAGEVSNLPPTTLFGVIGDNGPGIPFVWAEHTLDVRGLERPGSDRFAKAWYQVGMSSPGVFSLGLNVTDGLTHQVALYLLDWSAVGLAEQIDVLDARSLAVLDTQNVSDLAAGKYLVWNITGHVIFRITSTNPAFFVPVVSAIFLDPVVGPPAPAAVLGVTKTPDNGTFTQGSQVSFTIVVGNTAPAGAQPATNVQLTDTLPIAGGLTWPTVTLSQGFCTLTGGNALSCQLGTIAAQGSATVTVTSPATTPAAACQSQSNPAAIATADAGLSAQDSGSLTCTPPPPGVLSVTKTPDNGPFTQGSQVSFTIVVRNTAAAGAQPAANVQLTDTLPTAGGLTWPTVSPSQGTCTLTGGNLLSCSLGAVAPQGSVTVTVTSPATTPPAACQSQSNPAAIATADGGLSAQDSGSLTCTPPPAVLSVTKTPDNGPFTQGAQVSFTIVVRNTAAAGAQSATNVQLSDTLPTAGGLSWATASPSQGTCTLTGGNLLSCPLGTIAPQGSVTVTVSSPATTPPAACQSQLNSTAIATASYGLSAQDGGSLTCTPPAGDTTPPSVAVTGVLSNPTRVLLTVQDTGSGVKTIVVNTAVNVTVSIPSFAQGTTAAIVVTATKIDPNASSVIGVTVTDVAGNVTVFDPTDVTVTKGKAQVDTVTWVDGSENLVKIQNHGLRNIWITVNQQSIHVVIPPSGSQSVVVDIGQALVPGLLNSVTFQAEGGPPGSDAAVVITPGTGPGQASHHTHWIH